MKAKYFIFTLGVVALAACGPYRVEVSGEIDHKLSFDIEQLRIYFKKVCENESPPVSDIEACIDEKIGDFLSTIAGG